MTTDALIALATGPRAPMQRTLAALKSADAIPVSICIVTANRCDDVVAAIESAVAQDDPAPREIIVVDNASTDDTVRTLHAHFPAVRVIAAPVNLGCPAGRNLAMLVARGALIVHLDDDGVLAPDAVRRARAVADAHPDAGIVMMNIEERGMERLVAPSGTELPSFSGGACLMRRDALVATGLYAPEFLRQGEETDLLLRLLEVGRTVRYCHEARMEHRPRHRDGAQRASTVRLIEAHRIVNESLTAVKHLPWYRVPPIVAWHVAGFCVRSCQRGHPLDALHGLVRLCRALPRALASRWPCPRGARALRTLAREFDAQQWGTWVPMSHAGNPPR